jgi:DNA-binding HxlR family transcriptional regulator
MKVDVPVEVARLRNMLGAHHAGQELNALCDDYERLLIRCNETGAGADEPRRSLKTRIGEKWTTLILRCLRPGALHYAELLNVANVIAQAADVKISPKVLLSTLKSLQRDGMVSRHVMPAVLPQVQYQLTSLGVQFYEVVNNVMSWLDDHAAEVNQARAAFDGNQQNN